MIQAFVARMQVKFPVGYNGIPICGECGHEMVRHGVDATDGKTPVCFACLGVGQVMCSAMKRLERKHRHLALQAQSNARANRHSSCKSDHSRS